MKYTISWIESDFVPCLSSRSLIRIFVEVYGVREFVIKCNKFSIRGSHFILDSDNYDQGFFYMVSCFLTPRKINKVYKLLCKE